MDILKIEKFRIFLAYQAGLTMESIANGYQVSPEEIAEIIDQMINNQEG